MINSRKRLKAMPVWCWAHNKASIVTPAAVNGSVMTTARAGGTRPTGGPASSAPAPGPFLSPPGFFVNLLLQHCVAACPIAPAPHIPFSSPGTLFLPSLWWRLPAFSKGFLGSHLPSKASHTPSGHPHPSSGPVAPQPVGDAVLSLDIKVLRARVTLRQGR